MKRKNKIFRKVIIVLAVLALLTGCAGQEPEAEDTRTPTDDNLIVVGVSQEGSESVWRTANTRSVKETFTKENGYFLIFKNARQKQENQIKALRSFISQRVDYIVFSPIVEDGWDTVLQEAREAEIPVILMDRKINVKDESLYTAWVGSDFVEEGRNAGKWLEDYLSRANISILMVTHDRYFLDRVCSEIIEIDNKQIYSYKGNYSYYLEKRQERVEAMNADVERAKNLLRTELDWMRRQPQARGTKAKYRIDAFYELEKKAKQQRDTGKVNLDVKASYIGSKIFEAVNVSKRFGDLKITEDFNYIFARYEKMGIVGNNGTGKSTFIKMLMGEVAPDSGHFDVGETVRFGYYSQDGLKFDEQMKVIDVVQAIAEYVDLGNGQKMGVSQFLNYFLFTPEKQHSYVYKLSGGEKRRLYLCTVLMRSPNFLVLDEPTNDLDIVTLNVLEEYLRNFKGCAIVVSHDRYFMDKVVDHLLVFRGNADIKDFPGNYTQYRDWKDVQDQLEKEAEAALQARQNPAPEKPSRPVNEQKKKLTFKERKEFEALEEEIPALEAEKAELETAMSSGTLSTDELMAKSQRITQVMEEIDKKTMRWLELSELA